jgi:hypothetical protein
LFVETTVPNLLSALCSSDMQPRQHLELQQALFKQFAEIIDFTLKFDDLKVFDLSYSIVACSISAFSLDTLLVHSRLFL